MTVFGPVRRCLACGSSGSALEPYLNLGAQPLANAFHKGRDDEQQAIPLAVVFCTVCSHSQLTHQVSARFLFDDYLYVSGTTKTFRDHCGELARTAVVLTEKATPRVLDLACNDGTLMDAFRSLGCSVEGVDPAKNLGAITEAKGLDVHVRYWGCEALAAVTAHGFYDVVTATNVLGHVGDPLRFLQIARKTLAPGGFMVVEVPYWPENVTRGEFDQVYHEHLSYFTASSFDVLARRAGFNVLGTARLAIHGGSIRFFLGTGPDSEGLSKLLVDETLEGWDSEVPYRLFARRIERTKARFFELVNEERVAGRHVVGYGAAAKASTAWNYFGIAPDYVVDDNAMKWGLLTPGRNVPIRPPQTLEHDPARLAVVVGAWNFMDEIKGRLRALRAAASDDRLLTYVPRAHVEDLHARESRRWTL